MNGKGPSLRLRRFRILAVLAVATSIATPVGASAGKITLGTYVRGWHANPLLIDRYAQQVGRKPVIVLSYRRWGLPPFDRPQLQAVAQRGAAPLVTWEPRDDEGSSYRLGAIARGDYDGYVRRSAREAKAWGGPILLRFAHEMNGTWYPWGRGNNGSTPARYIAAWRHLVKVFRGQGADNVRWVWCPYVDGGHLPLKRFYPGDRWVDWVAVDGFNWGGSFGWKSFTEIFERSYRILVRMTSKPILIAETGSGEVGGSKARWVSRAFRRELPRLERIRAVVMFSAVDPKGDLRVKSSPTALSAFRSAIHSPRYASNRKLLLSLTPRSHRRLSHSYGW